MGRILLSICAVVVALGLGAAAQSPSDGSGREAGPENGNIRAGQNVEVPTELGRIASALEVQNTDDAAKREQDDLDAQTSMAYWAKMMFWAAFAQAFLSFVGIILIYITFQQTRRAADSADKMAEEAANATKAAFRSAAVAEKALVGIERPFVVITPIRSNSQHAAYTFSNHGRTPAVIMHSEVRYFAITPLDGPEPMRANVLQAALTPGWNVVPPGGRASGEEIVEPGTPVVQGAERADMWLLHGYVMYRALTGEIFVSGFGIYRQGTEPWQALRGEAFNYDERLEKGGPRKRERPKLTITAHKPDK